MVVVQNAWNLYEWELINRWISSTTTTMRSYYTISHILWKRSIYPNECHSPFSRRSISFVATSNRMNFKRTDTSAAHIHWASLCVWLGVALPHWGNVNNKKIEWLVVMLQHQWMFYVYAILFVRWVIWRATFHVPLWAFPYTDANKRTNESKWVFWIAVCTFVYICERKTQPNLFEVRRKEIPPLFSAQHRRMQQRRNFYRSVSAVRKYEIRTAYISPLTVFKLNEQAT